MKHLVVFHPGTGTVINVGEVALVDVDALAKAMDTTSEDAVEALSSGDSSASAVAEKIGTPIYFAPTAAMG